jgi:hypothetical protein
VHERFLYALMVTVSGSAPAPTPARAISITVMSSRIDQRGNTTAEQSFPVCPKVLFVISREPHHMKIIVDGVPFIIVSHRSCFGPLTVCNRTRTKEHEHKNKTKVMGFTCCETGAPEQSTRSTTNRPFGSSRAQINTRSA